MNLFEAVKESVSPRQIADYYGLSVRNDMVSCLFHEDRNPSMKLYDDHFYCFGCGKHGDVKLINYFILELAASVSMKNTYLGKINTAAEKCFIYKLGVFLCSR